MCMVVFPIKYLEVFPIKKNIWGISHYILAIPQLLGNHLLFYFDFSLWIISIDCVWVFSVYDLGDLQESIMPTVYREFYFA